VNRDREGESARSGRYRYKPMGLAYQGALEAVFAIVVGTGAGYWADSALGSSPWGLLVGATIGFAAFVLRLYRLGASLNRVTPEPESSEGEIHSAESSERAVRAVGHPGRGPDSDTGADGVDGNGAR